MKFAGITVNGYRIRTGSISPSPYESGSGPIALFSARDLNVTETVLSETLRTATVTERLRPSNERIAFDAHASGSATPSST